MASRSLSLLGMILSTFALSYANSINDPPALHIVKLAEGVTLPTPTPQQLKYQGTISALIHFGMATFFHDG